MPAVAQVGQALAGRAGVGDGLAVEGGIQPPVLARRDECERGRRRSQRFGIEIGGERHARDHGDDARIAMPVPRRVVELPVVDQPDDELLEPVERAAGERQRRPRAGMEVFRQVQPAMAAQSRRRPPAAGQRQRGVPAGRHAEHAHAPEVEPRREAGLAAEPVDGAGDLDRAAPPARRPGIAVVPVVVGLVLGQCDGEAGVDQRADEVEVDPRRPRRAVRDDDETRVAGRGHGAGGDLQAERAALLAAGSRRRRIEHRHRPRGLVAGQLLHPHCGMRRQRRDRRPGGGQQTQGAETEGKGTHHAVRRRCCGPSPRHRAGRGSVRRPWP